MNPIHSCDTAHAELIRHLSAETPETVLHLGCGVPLWLRQAPLLLRGRVVYRGFDEDGDLVARAAVEFPSLRFLRKDLDTVLTPADAVVIGPGLFRMCWGGASQTLSNASGLARRILAVATVPGADNAAREASITHTGHAVPLDVAACGIPAGAPSAVIPPPADGGFGYVIWKSPFPWDG